MDTLNAVLTYTTRAAACALVVLLSACGGGGGGGSAPDVAGAATTPAPATATATATVPAFNDVAAQPAAGASPVVVPSPPDMSIEPPPGTVVTPPAPDVSANVAAADTAAAAAAAAAPTVVTLGAPVVADLPDGATACQPGTCPAFAANGSVTNTRGADNPTAAHGYLLPASGATGAYPEFGNMPTMVLPPAPVTIVEAP